jgi:ribokinase
MNEKPVVCVVGSINMDLTVATDLMPRLGETILGNTFATYPGGKGANQAVAAARIGAQVNMIGAVGNDSFGDSLLTHLKAEGVNIDGVTMVQNQATGIANIILSNDDNRIIVVPGANNSLLPALVEKNQAQIRASDVVLIQFEIPMETVLYTLEIANKFNVPVIVNPAPYHSISKELLVKATYLTPNEIEVQALKNEPIYHSILEKVIITEGDKGVQFFENEVPKKIPSFQVDVKDTTGAGDTFNGALAAQLGSGVLLSEAVKYANAAAALSVTKLGAQGGMPSKEEVDYFIRERTVS